MEKSFDEALDEMWKLLDEKGAGAPPDEVDTSNPDDDSEAENDEDVADNDVNDDGTNEDIGDDLVDNEAQLREIAKLFDEYQEAMSNQNWEEVGRIMEEIEEKLDAYQ